MPEKNPENYQLLTYLWVLGLSAWGGLVSFYRKMKTGKARPFNVMELLGEIFTSAFVGMITFWICQATGIDQLLTAAFVGISGHMGSRGIGMLENYFSNKLGAEIPKDDNS